MVDALQDAAVTGRKNGLTTSTFATLLVDDDAEAGFVVGDLCPSHPASRCAAAQVRGVLGNKCAGHHNLKTVKFREMM